MSFIDHTSEPSKKYYSVPGWRSKEGHALSAFSEPLYPYLSLGYTLDGSVIKF